jgi:hypothetical protein
MKPAEDVSQRRTRRGGAGARHLDQRGERAVVGPRVGIAIERRETRADVAEPRGRRQHGRTVACAGAEPPAAKRRLSGAPSLPQGGECANWGSPRDGHYLSDDGRVVQQLPIDKALDPGVDDALRKRGRLVRHRSRITGTRKVAKPTKQRGRVPVKVMQRVADKPGVHRN